MGSKFNMKKNELSRFKQLFCSLALLSLLLLLVFGCGDPERINKVPTGSISEPTPKPAPAPEPQPEPEPIEIPTPIPTETPIPNPTPTPAPDNNPALASTASKLVWSGTSNSEVKQLALTFDAGWVYDPTLPLLDLLDLYQVKATFFLRGGWVQDHPDLAREINRRGHSIGNHSLTHSHMRAMTQDEAVNDIVTANNIIKNTLGYTPYLFRPPYGEYNNTLLNILGEQGYPYTVMWTIDSHDWAETMNGTQVTEQYLIDRILFNASDKGIVLMHVGGYQTVNALPEIITGLRYAGYELVKLDVLLPR